MKTQKKPEKKIIGTLLVLTAIGILSFIYLTAVNKGPAQSMVYSEEELRAFWEKEGRQLIQRQWGVAKLPYPEINSRIIQLQLVIYENTGKPFELLLITDYCSQNPAIQGAASIDERTSTMGIEIFVSPLFDQYKLLKSSGKSNWLETFHSHLLILAMHEMEHATVYPMPKVVSLEEESRAWAETCRHTIAPLVENHKVALAPNDTEAVFYEAWKASQGNVQKPEWQAAVKRVYGSAIGRQ